MRLLAAIGALAIAIAIAGAVYFFAGFYDVAAAGGGNAAVEWAVSNVREASVNRYMNAPPTPQWFSKPETVQAGAHEFVVEGCIRCHGAPGVKPDKFAAGMNPNPPELGEATKDDEPKHIFWIVKNGIRMTGMPAFGAHTPDDDIWKLVAFLKQMHAVQPEQFKQWASAGETPDLTSTQ